MNIMAYEKDVQTLTHEGQKLTTNERIGNINAMRDNLKIINATLNDLSKRAAADAEKHAVALSKMEG